MNKDVAAEDKEAENEDVEEDFMFGDMADLCDDKTDKAKKIKPRLLKIPFAI